MITRTVTLASGSIERVELLGETVFVLNDDGLEFWLGASDAPWALDACAGFRSADCPVAISGRGVLYLKARPGYDETVGVSIVSSER